MAGPQLELSEIVKPEKPAQPTETINGKSIPVSTLDQFHLAVYGKALERKENGDYPVLPMGLILGIEKFKVAGGKFYRLIWIGRGRAWLAAENTESFRTKTLAIATGYMLAGDTGAFFDEGTR